MSDQTRTVQQLKDLVQRFVDEREWQPYHNPKNLAMSIAIETAELMEHFQWWRTDELPALREDAKLMNDVREELADITCYVLSFATTMGIDLADALEAKLVKNREKYPAEKFRGRFSAD